MVAGFPFRKLGLCGLYAGVIFSLAVWPRALPAGPRNQPAQYVYHVPQQLQDGWEVASLQEAGVNAEKITELMNRILDNTFEDIYSVVLVKDGKLILDEYFNGRNGNKRHEIKSVTKSIGSVLTGIAVDKGFIESVDEKIYPSLKTLKPEAQWGEEEKNMTLRHLLTMTSGYDCDDQLTGFGCQTKMSEKSDWVKFTLNLPMKSVPGRHWAYNSSTPMLIAEVIKAKSGVSIQDFAKTYLFQPLGIQDGEDFQWLTLTEKDDILGGQDNHRVFFAGGASMKPRAMAKLGYMVLNDGQWRSHQIVSRTWISESTGAHATTNRNFRYGYLWWRGEAVVNNQKINAFWAAGNGGQRIFVMPQLNLVAVFTGGNFGEQIAIQTHGMLTTYIVPAVLPPAPPRQTVSLDSSAMQKYLGQYVFKKNTKLEQKLKIERQGQTLLLKPSGWSKIEIFPENEHQFFGTSKELGDILVRFALGANGNVTHMTVDFALTSWPCEKL